MIGMVKKRINDLEIEKAELERQIDTRPTLRDQFAMAALTGLLPKLKDVTATQMAAIAYHQADRMMEARKQKGD